jgi:hypothetical protein
LQAPLAGSEGAGPLLFVVNHGCYEEAE